MFTRRLLVVLLIVAFTLIVGSNVEVAHPGTNTRSVTGSVSHEVKFLPLPARLCTALLAKHPELATDPHGCDVTVVSETDQVAFNANSHYALNDISRETVPTSCPSGTNNHIATYYGPLHLFAVSMRETFVYPGNCDVPTVSGSPAQACMIGFYTDWPFSNLRNLSCINFVSGSNRIAEGTYAIDKAFVGTDSLTMEAIANSFNKNVSDNFV